MPREPARPSAPPACRQFAGRSQAPGKFAKSRCSDLRQTAAKRQCPSAASTAVPVRPGRRRRGLGRRPSRLRGLGVGVERAAGQPPVEEQSQGSGERPRVARWNTLSQITHPGKDSRLVRDRAVVHRGAGPRLGRGVDEGAAAVALAATGVRQRGMACGSFGVRPEALSVMSRVRPVSRSAAWPVTFDPPSATWSCGTGSRSAWKLPALTAAAAPADSSRVTGTASAILSSFCMMNPSTLKAAPSVHAHPPTR